MRSKRGITLISLVITVIVLLILATVAINLAVNSEGLFTKAGDAANKWNTAVAEEEIMINEILDYANPVGSYVTQTSTVAGVEKERSVPIPKGYVASKATGENTIAGGLVIYESGKIEVNDTNHNDAVKEYNQYVWIPVDEINDMVMCSVCGGGVENLVYDDETQTLACTSIHEEGKTPRLVGKLYTATMGMTQSADAGGNAIIILDYNMNFEQSNQEYPEDYTSFREPGTVTEDEAMLLTQMQSDFNNMAKSVAKYGGFYISRYEIGANRSSKKGQTVLNDTSPTNWYTLHSTLRKTGSSITSQMIWGCQYDQVIKFIGEEAEVGHGDRNLSGSPAISGNNPDDEMMNIYDLESNYLEFTAETGVEASRSYRGGNYKGAGNRMFMSASNRDSIAPSLATSSATSRAALFVNL